MRRRPAPFFINRNKTEYDLSLIHIFDTDKLDKILYNLLSNAAKYNKEGGYIQVTLMYRCV